MHRKGGKTVTIPLARTARALDLAVGERLEGPIFVGSSGDRMTRDAAARIVRRIAKAAGITKQIGPHSLRHSFITAALDAGVPLRDVQEAASHADPRTTMRYDRARQSLDRHATYIVATFVAGSSRGDTAHHHWTQAPERPTPSRALHNPNSVRPPGQGTGRRTRRRTGTRRGTFLRQLWRGCRYAWIASSSKHSRVPSGILHHPE